MSFKIRKSLVLSMAKVAAPDEMLAARMNGLLANKSNCDQQIALAFRHNSSIHNI